MPKVSKESAAIVEDHGVVVDHREDVEGYEISFVTFHEGADGGPMLKGLPNDQCQCPHWGYVLEGRAKFTFDDHEETLEAGDAFYLPAGHVPFFDAGTEVLMFSPAEQAHETMDAIRKNMAALQGA